MKLNPSKIPYRRTDVVWVDCAAFTASPVPADPKYDVLCEILDFNDCGQAYVASFMGHRGPCYVFSRWIKRHATLAEVTEANQARYMRREREAYAARQLEHLDELLAACRAIVQAEDHLVAEDIPFSARADLDEQARGLCRAVIAKIDGTPLTGPTEHQSQAFSSEAGEGQATQGQGQ